VRLALVCFKASTAGDVNLILSFSLLFMWRRQGSARCKVCLAAARVAAVALSLALNGLMLLLPASLLLLREGYF
jgi:uncharacterized membrane protein